MKVRALGYVGLSVRDVRAWDDLLTKIVGVVPGDGSGAAGCAQYRLDERKWRLQLEQGDVEGLAFMGWELGDDADFEEALKHLHDCGLTVEMGDGADRNVAALASVRDPAGNRLEFYYGAKVPAMPVVLPFQIEGFKTGALGMGHLLLGVTQVAAIRDFYTRTIGMRLTDYTRLGAKAAYFLRCNPRHHTIAVTDAMAPGLNHFLLEMNSIDDVGRAYDRALDQGATIINSLGRHRNDKMLSFYMRSPSGLGIEIGWGGLEVDEDSWIATEFDGGGIWGHRGSMNDALRAQERKKA